MALEKKQIRYIKDGDPRNTVGASKEALIAGSLFSGTTRIVELTVSAIPGFGFYVNDTPFPIRVMSHGDTDQYNIKEQIFKFDSNILALQPIYNIKCEAASLQRLINYNETFSNDQQFLMIDYTEEVNS